MSTPLIPALVLALAAGASCAQSVALSGVAGSKALVIIDGSAPKFMNPGQTLGTVKLLSTQGESAVIEVNGQRQTLRVGDAPVSVGRGEPDTGEGVEA
jgi:aspartyl protease family protein